MIHSQRGIDTLVLAPVSATDDQTVTCRFDTNGADYATLRILYTTQGTDASTASISLLSSEDTVVSNFATITADITPTTTANKEIRYEVDMKSQKRWLRLVINNGTATGSDFTVGVLGTLTRNNADPASTTAMGDDDVTIV